jgi:hypothetical protein
MFSSIAYISFNILKNVIEEFATFSMQLDETTDMTQCSKFLVFARYVHADAMKEEFLFSVFVILTGIRTMK